MIVLQPNIRLVGGSYWDFLDHKTPLTERSLEEAAQTAGLETERLITRFLPYTTKSRFPQRGWLVRGYLAFPPAWWLLGKQSLLIARSAARVRVRILVTGAAGFINGYLVPELLEAGHEVIGLDDFSKYGRLTKSYDDHPRYRFVEGDAKDVALMTRPRGRRRPGRRGSRDDRRDQLLPRVRLRPDRRERADPRFDVRRGDRGPPGRPHRADHRRQHSMVYESATVFPTPEGAQLTSPPPVSTYGFQKLAAEYFARAPGSNTSCRTRSSARSTASASASGGPSATRT